MFLRAALSGGFTAGKRIMPPRARLNLPSLARLLGCQAARKGRHEALFLEDARPS
ncbi:MAG: hypothetical protein LBT05_12505 [Planctomycetaceae bacterium]|nr:hypothetical protein [Planctomycetaceae bacterium]